MKIGVIGCGSISGIYFKNITTRFQELEIAGICDVDQGKAMAASKEWGIPKVYADMHEMLSDPMVEIVLNLTRPYEHFDVDMAAIRAGKHVYSEKPLGATLDEGKKIIAAAKEKNVMVCGAPDTFLGAGIQTCRKLIDDGFIGKPVGASAFMACRGHESWHPDPEFYYKYGGGPMLDMGPYYLTALVSLLGEVSDVAGMAKASFPQRVITSEPKNGTVVDVEVDTYITGMMSFKNGAVGTIFTTFDVHAAQVPRIEIYGSKGTLSVPDPNTFGGDVMLYRPESKEFLKMPLLFENVENSRGLGLLDMARSLKNGTHPRAGSDMTLHVLEIMSSFITSSKERRFVTLESHVERPEPLNI